jgi:uncharacterized protein
MNASIDSVLREAERVAKQGLRELLIPITTNEPYSSPKFAPLWSALQDLGLPVGVHTGTGVGEDIMASYERLGVGEGATYFKMVEPMRWLINMIWSGIPQSYPKLRFVIVEGGIGWIASVLRFMDHWWEDHHLWVEPGSTNGRASILNVNSGRPLKTTGLVSSRANCSGSTA